MKRLAITTCLVLVVLSTSGCFRGRSLRIFGLRGAPCGPAKCVSGVTSVGSSVISAPSVTSTACPGGQCLGTAVDDIPSVYDAPATIYGEPPVENEVLPRGAESASATTVGSDIVFSRVLSDRKLTAADGKLPEPKLDK